MGHDPSRFLPADLSEFVGRREELAAGRRLLAERRLITVTGLGGIGKTRLASRLARQVRDDYPDGTYWVELTSVEESGIGEAIAAGLGLRSADETLDGIIGLIRDRPHVLLALDGCEHVANATAEVLTTVLRNAPSLTVLATSRRPLGVYGETLLKVAELSVEDATDLFTLRATGTGTSLRDADSADVRAVVTAVDRFPLAIELAAAELAVLPLAELIRHLDDRRWLLTRRADGVAAMSDVLAATWESCTTDEQRLWAGLTVFRAGCTLPALRAVCGDQLDAELLDAARGLITKSVVRLNPSGRYTMLDTLAEFGRARLAAGEHETTIKSRHLE